MDPVEHESRHRAAARSARARRRARAAAVCARNLARVLDETTVADAAEVYAAIRLARPGGLGHAATEDVTTHPVVTLREAMELAAEHDAVAREYVTDFAMTFEVGVPALAEARADGLPWTDATVEAYLGCSAPSPTPTSRESWA